MQYSPAPGPDFVCIGMPKAGTGWLFDQLRYHPEFWMPPIKELGFLKDNSRTMKSNAKRLLKDLKAGREKRWEKVRSYANRTADDYRDLEFLEEVSESIGQPLRIDRYAALFRFKESALSGDVTPGYCALSEETISRFAAKLPETKIILLVRDPVDRAWSRICMWHRRDILDKVVLESDVAFRSLMASEKFNRESFPTKVLERWRRTAPKLEFRYFLFDDIARNPEQSRQEILRFLGADPLKASGDLNAGHNKKASSEKLELTHEKKIVLVEHFREELRACSDAFGGEARNWKARYGI